MSAHPSRWLRGSKTLGFLAAFLLVLAGTSQAPKPVIAAEPHPADFDPLYDLPLPPAWRDGVDFAATAAALRDQITSAGKARVRVDLRLPAVEGDRLDEAQSADWEQDQAAAGADLLDSLPDGSYQRLDEGPEVKSLIRAGTGAGVADDVPVAVDDPTAFDWPADANAIKPPASAVATTPSLALEVGEAALEGLMASTLVAKVQASSGNALIAAGRSYSLLIGSDAASGPGAPTGPGNWATGRPPIVPRPPRSSPGSPTWPAGYITPWPSRPTAVSGPGVITVTGNCAGGTSIGSRGFRRRGWTMRSTPWLRRYLFKVQV